MFNNDYSRLVLSALGALMFSTALVSAAVGPARMVEKSPVVYAEAAPPVADVANG